MSSRSGISRTGITVIRDPSGSRAGLAWWSPPLWPSSSTPPPSMLARHRLAAALNRPSSALARACASQRLARAAPPPGWTHGTRGIWQPQQRRALSSSGRADGGRGSGGGGAGGAESRRGVQGGYDNYGLAAAMCAVALGAVGLSYASVPLYRIFCQARPARTGLNSWERSA